LTGATSSGVINSKKVPNRYVDNRSYFWVTLYSPLSVVTHSIEQARTLSTRKWCITIA